PPPAAHRPRLSVVVVNYHSWADTLRLVEALRAAPAFRVGLAEAVVVDNHSPASPRLPRLRRTPGVAVRRWKPHRGFARAVHEGVRLALGEWVLLLNPDVTIPPALADLVLERAAELRALDERVGVVGFALRHDDGGEQLSTGPFPTLRRTLAGLL